MMAIGINAILIQDSFVNPTSMFEKNHKYMEIYSENLVYKGIQQPITLFEQGNSPNTTGTQGNTNQGNPSHGSMKKQIENSSKFQFQFLNNVALNGSANNNISLNAQYDSKIMNRFFGFHLNNEDFVNISLNAQASFLNTQNSQIPKPSIISYLDISKISKKITPILSVSEPITTQYSVDYSYSTFYTMDFVGSFDSIQIYTTLDSILGVTPEKNQDISWAIFDNSTNQWDLVETSTEGENIVAEINGNDLESNQLILTLVYISPIITPDNFWTSTLGILILGFAVLTLIFGSLMTNQEYRDYLLNRFLPINKGPHRLTMEEVLENENRTNIISAILEKPGIHFNALLREINISAGTLAWHLDILDTFKVIRKERVGQYLLYFSFLDSNPISKLDSKLQKSRTTLEIMQIIKDNPGIYQNQIAKRLDLDHKTVKYHLDKLKEVDIVISKKSGRRNLFYPIDLHNLVSE